MIIPKYKAIFVHIPRTGGTSIENTLFRGTIFPDKEALKEYTQKSLYEGELKHLSILEIKSRIKKEAFDSAYKFSFVRNPWDKVVSEMLFMQRKFQTTNTQVRDLLSPKECQNVESYLDAIQKKEDYFLWREQWKFLFDEDRNLLMDNVFRFENLERSYEKIMEKIQFSEDRTLAHRSKTAHAHYSNYYTDETRDLVSKLYATDIDLFGYKFEEATDWTPPWENKAAYKTGIDVLVQEETK